MADTIKSDLIISGLRAMQWEKVKGELRAMVAILGNTTQARPVGDDPDELAPWEQFEERVDDFIKEVETSGIQE